MNVHAFATDYDGTIADANRVAEPTARALERVRASGRKLLLVTGRMLPDLRAVCPDVDRMFDAVVAENGALVYFPDRRELRTLGDPPEPALVDALRRRGVPFELGAAILATHAPFAEPALAAIQETGVNRTPVFNKGALMLLPGGVTKGTGLAVALAALELSPHNMVGIGDAENDHAFLALSECAVAVADAVPALRERADYVTRAPSAAGVVEFIEEHLLHDLVDLMPRLTRHDLPLGETPDGPPVTVPAHGTRLLIVGPSGSGKSTLTGVLVERVVESGRSLLLLDPEGDYRTLSELERVRRVRRQGRARAARRPTRWSSSCASRPASLVLDLSAMSRSEKVAYATTVLATVATVRSQPRPAPLARGRRGPPRVPRRGLAGRRAAAARRRVAGADHARRHRPGRAGAPARQRRRLDRGRGLPGRGADRAGRSRGRRPPERRRQRARPRRGGAGVARARRPAPSGSGSAGAGPASTPPAQVHRGRASAGPLVLLPRSHRQPQPARRQPGPLRRAGRGRGRGDVGISPRTRRVLRAGCAR